jgi:hypothetical protein
MYRVTRLNPVSWAKAFTLAWLVIAVIVGLVFALPAAVFGGLGALVSEDMRPLILVVPAVLFGGLFALALAAIFVFIVSLVQGAAFNWALGRTGGLEVNLDLGPDYRPATSATAAPPPAVPPPATAAELPPPATPAPAMAPPAETIELPSPVAAEADPGEPTVAWPPEAGGEGPVSAETAPENAGDSPS